MQRLCVLILVCHYSNLWFGVYCNWKMNKVMGCRKEHLRWGELHFYEDYAIFYYWRRTYFPLLKKDQLYVKKKENHTYTNLHKIWKGVTVFVWSTYYIGYFVNIMHLFVHDTKLLKTSSRDLVDLSILLWDISRSRDYGEEQWDFLEEVPRP